MGLLEPHVRHCRGDGQADLTTRRSAEPTEISQTAGRGFRAPPFCLCSGGVPTRRWQSLPDDSQRRAVSAFRKQPRRPSAGPDLRQRRGRQHLRAHRDRRCQRAMRRRRRPGGERGACGGLSWKIGPGVAGAVTWDFHRLFPFWHSLHRAFPALPRGAARPFHRGARLIGIPLQRLALVPQRRCMSPCTKRKAGVGNRQLFCSAARPRLAPTQTETSARVFNQCQPQAERLPDGGAPDEMEQSHDQSHQCRP